MQQESAVDRFRTATRTTARNHHRTPVRPEPFVDGTVAETAASEPVTVPERAAEVASAPAEAPVPAAGPGAGDEGRPEPDHRNEIVVAGRITAEPLIRELPSGDQLATWRICVVRRPDSRYSGRRFDSITCVSFDRKLHEGVRAWRRGDVVQMSGELRRRTWRGREGVRSVCEVEARTAALVRALRSCPVESKAPRR